MWGEKYEKKIQQTKFAIVFFFFGGGGGLKLSPLTTLKKNTELTADRRCTLRRMASKHYKMPRRPFSKLCSNLCAYCSNKLPERGPTIAWLYVLLIMTISMWADR